jgi:hypothetical protein
MIPSSRHQLPETLVFRHQRRIRCGCYREPIDCCCAALFVARGETRVGLMFLSSKQYIDFLGFVTGPEQDVVSDRPLFQR